MVYLVISETKIQQNKECRFKKVWKFKTQMQRKSQIFDGDSWLRKKDALFCYFRDAKGVFWSYERFVSNYSKNHAGKKFNIHI